MRSEGGGPVEALVAALRELRGVSLRVVDYSEHALGKSADAEAICYIQLNIDGVRHCGIGRSHDIIQASLDGILGAINMAARSETVTVNSSP